MGGAELATHSASCMPDSGDEWESEDVYANQFASRYQVDALGRSNVVIFDWDDTLLCSTAVRQQQWVVEELQNLEVAIEMILRTAMSLGKTVPARIAPYIVATSSSLGPCSLRGSVSGRS